MVDVTCPGVRREQVKEIAPIEWQVIHLLSGDLLGYGGSVSIQSDLIRRHFHALGNRARQQLHVHAHLLRNSQMDVIRHGLLKSSRLDDNPVYARGEVGSGEISR